MSWIFDLNFVSVKCFQEDFEKLAFQKAYLEIRFCVSKINVSEKLVSSFRCSWQLLISSIFVCSFQGTCAMLWMRAHRKTTAWRTCLSKLVCFLMYRQTCRDRENFVLEVGRIHLTTSGDNEIRTRDLLLARQALSQLSYTPIGLLSYIWKVGLSGLEPPTSRLSGVRSNRLSYKPSLFLF